MDGARGAAGGAVGEKAASAVLRFHIGANDKVQRKILSAVKQQPYHRQPNIERDVHGKNATHQLGTQDFRQLTAASARLDRGCKGLRMRTGKVLRQTACGDQQGRVDKDQCDRM